MPIRMLRDWTDSDIVNKLTWQAEIVFIRLIMKADDYGRFHADTRILKASLFPLRLDQVRDADITRWIAECEKSGLIAIYEVQGKKYLEIKNFGQRLRTMKSRFPSDSSPPQSADNCPPEEEEKKEIEYEEEKKGKAAPVVLVFPFEGEVFKNKWLSWKDYRKKEHGFKFKSVETEQTSLFHLKNLSEGDEQIAINIIQQSLDHTWKGFFPIKITEKNGKKEDATVYIPAKFYEPPIDLAKEIINQKNKTYNVKNLIDEDILKIKTNPDFIPRLGAMKLEYLRKNLMVVFTQEQIDGYDEAAKGERVRQVHENMEEVANRALRDAYKRGIVSEDEKSKIKVIAKEMAYLDYLKSQVEQKVIL